MHRRCTSQRSSTVHALPSSHAVSTGGGVPPLQVARRLQQPNRSVTSQSGHSKQCSTPLQTLPSLQSASVRQVHWRGVCTQPPVVGSHESSVHGFPSSHEIWS